MGTAVRGRVRAAWAAPDKGPARGQGRVTRAAATAVVAGFAVEAAVVVARHRLEPGPWTWTAKA